MDPSTKSKRGRGRPRKNVEMAAVKPTEEKKEKKDENIVLFLALSDEESVDNQNDNQNDNHDNNQDNDSGEDNRFTTNDTETKNNAVDSISDSDSDSDSESEASQKMFGNKQLNVKMLIEEIKKRDQIINSLRSKAGSAINQYTASKRSNINYHCVQLADFKMGHGFVPQPTNIHCWWDGHGFDNLPVYIVSYFRKGIYYVFGNFCSFNCALKYNIKMLKDCSWGTRHALTISLKIKVTGNSAPIKFAGARELLQANGGPDTIKKFREDFSIITTNLRMNMPPIIPLVHVIEQDNKD
jgi:hypothetical protein